VYLLFETSLFSFVEFEVVIWDVQLNAECLFGLVSKISENIVAGYSGSLLSEQTELKWTELNI